MLILEFMSDNQSFKMLFIKIILGSKKAESYVGEEFWRVIPLPYVRKFLKNENSELGFLQKMHLHSNYCNFRSSHAMSSVIKQNIKIVHTFIFRIQPELLPYC